MIKALLPSFDPKQPLAFDFVCFARVGGSAGVQPGGAFNAFNVELWAGDFVGWAIASVDAVIAPESGGFSFRTQARFTLPESVGLTGGEGWFRLTALASTYVFVTDCIVTYAPASAQGAPVNQGYFS
jgi:hypothetical protein